jgi:hypothetical protein
MARATGYSARGCAIAALREGRFDNVDVENVSEEIESLGAAIAANCARASRCWRSTSSNCSISRNALRARGAAQFSSRRRKFACC